MLEVVRMLEKNGRKGRVLFLDSSPLIVKQRLIFATEELMHNEICGIVLRLLLGKTFKEEVIQIIHIGLLRVFFKIYHYWKSIFFST